MTLPFMSLYEPGPTSCEPGPASTPHPHQRHGLNVRTQRHVLLLLAQRLEQGRALQQHVDAEEALALWGGSGGGSGSGQREG